MRVRFAARFAGPPGHANGGFLAGTLAGEGPARVTIRRPVPLETDLEFDGRTLRAPAAAASPAAAPSPRGEDGAPAAAPSPRGEEAAPAAPSGAVLAEVEEVVVDVGEVPVVSLEAARAAGARTPLAEHHPFPGCFGCGPAHPSGLHCLPGEAGDGVWAVAWTPEEVAAPFVWSALDCPSSAPVVIARGGRPHVLGRIDAHVHGEVAAGEPHVVVAWGRGEDGRRKHSASAVLRDGRPVAVALATWFAL